MPSPKLQENQQSLFNDSEETGRILITWARVLAYIIGTPDQELLLRNKYPAAENRILKAQIKTRLLLSDAAEVTLAEIGRRPGPEALGEVAAVAKPKTILGWYRTS